MNNKSSSSYLILPNKYVITQLEQGFMPQSPRDWSRKVKGLYGNCCVVTGISSKQGKIDAHHINSKKDFPQLTFSLLNGLPLLDVIHKDLHKACGLNTNISQLQGYLEIVFKNNPQLESSRLILLIDWVTFLESELKKK